MKPSATETRWAGALVPVAVTLGLVAFVVWATKYHFDQRAEVRAIEEATAQLQAAHMAADSCAITLRWEQEGFLQFDSAVDSLRLAMEGFEDAGQGGVPEEHYPAYLEVFEAYNDSVAVWQVRADSVQVAEVRCRALTEAHNLLRDSLQARFGSSDDASG